MLDIKSLQTTIEDNQIVKDVSFKLNKGEIVVLMGPNGSGKSTIANSIMGHPSCDVRGEVTLEGQSILDMPVDERSRAGLFLSFQYPAEIDGVTVSSFLRMAMNAHLEKPMRISQFKVELIKNMELLNIPADFANRYLNKGFSGGEKKKMEILQLLMIKPKVAILDETDSGLDVDALKKVSESIIEIRKLLPDMVVLVITHYQRILHYLHPDKVLILNQGKIVKEGGNELVQQIEESGFDQFI